MCNCKKKSISQPRKIVKQVKSLKVPSTGIKRIINRTAY